MAKYKYTVEEVKNICKEVYHMAEVCRRLNILPAGGNYKTLSAFVDRHHIDVSHFRGSGWNKGETYKNFNPEIPLEDILVENSEYISSNNLRKKLIKKGIKEAKCEKCKRTEWEGLPIALELDHINGNNRDNRIENLRILCPNCHAQTSTYRGKRIKVKEKVKKKEIKVKTYTPVYKHNCKNCNTGTHNKTFCSYNCRDTYNRKEWPSKEELIRNIQTYKSYLGVGKQFNVSDNTVRQWCKTYGLNINEIKQATMAQLVETQQAQTL